MNDRPGIDIDVGNIEGGWATVTITAGRQRVQVRCSDIVDSLGDLLRGLAGLLERSGKFEVEFTTEGQGAYLATIRRDGDALEVVAKRVLNDFDDADIEAGRQSRARLRWRGPFREGVASFAAPFERLRARLGPVGYKTGWLHDFPEEAMRKIRESNRAGV